MRLFVGVMLWMLVLSGTGSAREEPGGSEALLQEGMTFPGAEGAETGFLPPPPAFGSLAFEHDRAMYEYGLSVRGTKRGAEAARDVDLNRLPEYFSEAFGAEITMENTPELFSLMQRVLHEFDSMSVRRAKKKYKRIRPFVLYNTQTCFPDAEEHLRKNGSYPSGHSARAWGMALLLSEINPGRREFLLRRGFEYGQSRVICGYHWQSDVDAGRLAGSAGFADLHANEKFLRHLQTVREEFARLRAAGRVKVR
ncbi:MAG: phosphatase PAP2 family protein [Desulfovibrio sp.]|nr:phosphatase PAP2 family protein [Desulfovibrio sp.]